MINAAKQSGLKKDKLFNFRPIFFAAVFLIFGIIFAYYRILHGVSAWWLFLLLPLAVAPFFFVKGKEEGYKRVLALCLLAAFFLTGFIAFRSQLYSYSNCAYYNGEYAVTGTVVKKSKGQQAALVVLEDVTFDGEEVEGRLNAYLPTSFFGEIQIADVLLIEGKVKTITDLSKQNDFNAYKIGDSIRYSVSSADGYAIAGKSNNLFLLVRRRMERVLYTGMDETTASVTLAMLTGDATGIEDGLLDNMRFGGIAHIFAVSGLHVGALYAFCLLIFSRTTLRKTSKPVRFLLLSFLLIFYAGVCGFSASILRATVLCLVSYFMRLLGAKTDSLNVLSLAAIFILLLTPSALFEIGFQLSFMASLGILLLSKRIGQVCDELYNLFRKRFPRRLSEEEEKTLQSGDTLPLAVGEKALRFCVSVFSASLAAQIMTAPLQYMAFGYLSGWSLLLNLFFVPLISGVFAVLLALVALSCLLPTFFSAYLLYLPKVLWNALLLLFEIFDFSTFALTGIQLSGESCVCYYGGVFFFSDKWNISKKQRSILAIACFTAFGCILALLNL